MDVDFEILGFSTKIFERDFSYEYIFSAIMVLVFRGVGDDCTSSKVH